MKITRSEIHALVWSQPTFKVAALIGISGNTLKKSCERRGIPTPPRGYWQQLAAGKHTHVEPMKPVMKELTLPWEKTKAFEKALREVHRSVTLQDEVYESSASSKSKVSEQAREPADPGLASWQNAEAGKAAYPQIESSRNVPHGAEESFDPARGAELKTARGLAQDRMVLREVAELCSEILRAAQYQSPKVKKAMQEFVWRALDQASLANPVLKAIQLCEGLA